MHRWKRYPRWISFGIFLITSLQCSLEDPGPPGRVTGNDLGTADDPELLVQWYLTTREDLSPRIEYLADLPCSLLSHGVLLTPIEGVEYRLDDENWIRTKSLNEAAYLKNLSRRPITETPEILLSHRGLDDDSLFVEIGDAKLWLEERAQAPCPTYAYAYHAHDRRAMETVEACGYLGARDGWPGRSPWGASLLGNSWDPVWLDSWNQVSIWETPLSIGCQEIQSLDVDEIDDWLQAPGRLPAWKENGTWIQLFTHTDDIEHANTPILDVAHLGRLLDALLADGEVWIASVGKVAAYLRGNHHPSDLDPLVWLPMDMTDVPEDRTGPFQGKACAFSFSTDDGWKANLHSYAPLFQLRELDFTAYLNPVKILASDAGEMDEALYYMNTSEVVELAAMGMEIGNHGMTHEYTLPQAVGALSLAPNAEFQTEIEIRVENSMKILRLFITPQ